MNEEILDFFKNNKAEIYQQLKPKLNLFVDKRHLFSGPFFSDYYQAFNKIVEMEAKRFIQDSSSIPLTPEDIYAITYEELAEIIPELVELKESL
jgi:hypothetical protein